MIILGHKTIKSEEFTLIETLNDADNYDSNLSLAIVVHSIKDAIFANAMGIKYIITTKEDAPKIQKIANEYLFDSRVIVKIKSEDEIESLAVLGIDGVLFD